MNVNAHLGTIEYEGATYQAIEPEYQTGAAAAVDLATPYDFDLKPGERAVVNTGIIAHAPRGYAFFILPRSSVSHKREVYVSNSPGLIDSDYSGKNDYIGVAMVNRGTEVQSFKRGDRIAQMMLVEVPRIFFRWHPNADFYSPVSRGGFGSTDRKIKAPTYPMPKG